MRKSRIVAVLFTVIAISACGSTTSPANTSPASSPDTSSPDNTSPDTTSPDATSPDTGPAVTDLTSFDVSALVNRDWIVDGHYTIGGLQPVAVGSTAALWFSDNGDGTGTVEVDTGCNTGSADVIYGPDSSLTVAPIALTKKACSDELNALESLIVGLLEHPQLWTVADDTLNLSPANVTDSGLQLIDASTPSPGTTSTTTPSTTPTTDIDGTVPGPAAEDVQRLLQTEWVAERFITVGPLDPIPASSGAGLRFQDSTTISINTGCNQGTGTVTFADDGSFTVSDLAMTEMACDDDGLELRIVGLFEHPLQWGVDGDTLTIYPLDVSDTGMVLRDAAVPTTTISVEDAAAADRAAIIAASALSRSESASGQSFVEIAIVETLGQPGPDGMVVFEDGDIVLTEAERAAVEAAFAPVIVRWVASKDDPVLRAATAAGQVEAVIALSDPSVEGDEANIFSDLFCGFAPTTMCALGGGVTVERHDDGTWVVAGPFGPQWIA